VKYTLILSHAKGKSMLEGLIYKTKDIPDINTLISSFDKTPDIISNYPLLSDYKLTWFNEREEWSVSVHFSNLETTVKSVIPGSHKVVRGLLFKKNIRHVDVLN